MKKLLLVLLLLFIVCLGIVYVLRQSSKILTPLSQSSPVYDLVAILEKNQIYLTIPPIMNGGAIQASISGIVVSFSPDKDFSQQIRALQLVLPKVKMDTKRVSEIDLRFNKVVIKY